MRQATDAYTTLPIPPPKVLKGIAQDLLNKNQAKKSVALNLINKLLDMRSENEVNTAFLLKGKTLPDIFALKSCLH